MPSKLFPTRNFLTVHFDLSNTAEVLKIEIIWKKDYINNQEISSIVRIG